MPDYYVSVVEDATSTAEYQVSSLGLWSLSLQLACFVAAFWVGLKIWPPRRTS